MRFSFRRALPALSAVVLALGAFDLCVAQAAATGGYQQINLTSNVPGMAHHTDPNLVNGWGAAFFPGVMRSRERAETFSAWLRGAGLSKPTHGSQSW